MKSCKRCTSPSFLQALSSSLDIHSITRPSTAASTAPPLSLMTTTRAMTYVAPTLQPNTSCVACYEEHAKRNATSGSCGHIYCAGCLSELFRLAVTPESRFPPRCCGRPLIFDNIRHLLGTDLARAIEEKVVECTTPHRVYCHDYRCATHIPPAFVRTSTAVAACPACAEVTCTICIGAVHDGDCPPDFALQQLRNTAVEAGWKECACGRIIEKTFGCYHMTCVTITPEFDSNTADQICAVVLVVANYATPAARHGRTAIVLETTRFMYPTNLS